MDIHIHPARVHVDEDDGKRIAPAGQESVIGLDDRVGQATVLHIAPVDEEVDIAAIGSMERRQTGIAIDAKCVTDRSRGCGVFANELGRLHKIDLGGKSRVEDRRLLRAQQA